MDPRIDILVVDDDAQVRQLLGEFLRVKSDAVREAPSAKDGLRVMRDKQAQIVFVDLMLPDMSGIDLMRNFAKEFPKTYCVALTGTSDETLMNEAFLAGACDFVRKPFSLSSIEEVLQRCVDRLKARKNQHFYTASLDRATLELKLPTSSAALAPALCAIMQLLTGFLQDREMRQVQLALDEALRNAYEHGNLGVTSKEKTDLQEAGTFEDELAARSKVAQKAGKSILVRAEISAGKFSCTITDQGKGFDWRSVPDPLANPELLLQPRGRGVFLIHKVFDQIEYNDAGNEICLKKLLK